MIGPVAMAYASEGATVAVRLQPGLAEFEVESQIDLSVACFGISSNAEFWIHCSTAMLQCSSLSSCLTNSVCLQVDTRRQCLQVTILAQRLSCAEEQVCVPVRKHEFVCVCVSQLV